MRLWFKSSARPDRGQCRAAVFVLVLSVVAAGAATAASAADGMRRLGAAQMKAVLIGKTVTDEAHWSDSFYPDGRLKSLVLGELRRGTWHLEGDRLCITREDKHGRKEETECNEIWKSKNRVEYRRDGTTAAEGVLRDQR